ncbi:MAG: histidine kinase dimerization/phospho-acceptor domain-containing protein, partial [Terrimicrobiaceae bacterium]
MLETTIKRPSGLSGFKPVVDALIVGLIVFATFLCSAFLVHSNILAQVETHRHVLIESAAWKAAASASAFFSATGKIEEEDFEKAKVTFAKLQARESSIQSLSILVKKENTFVPLLHIDKDELSPMASPGAPFRPSPQDHHESTVALATGDLRMAYPDADSTVAYAPVSSPGGSSQAVIRVQGALPLLAPLLSDRSCLFQVLAIATAIAGLSGFFVYRSSKRQQDSFRELAEAEKRLRDVADAAGGFIWEVNAQGLYVHVSNRVTQVAGYTAAELIGHSPFDINPGEDVEAIRKKSDTIVASGLPFRDFEERMIRKDGTIIWVSVNGVPVKDDMGNLIGYRGATMDISDRKQNEEDLIREKEAAQSAAVAKNQFLAMMSHEIRTPLNSVIGFSEILAESHLDEAQRKHLDMVRRNGNALLELIEDILEFSRAESGKLVLSPEPTNVREFVQRVVDLHLPAAVEKDLG